MFLRRCSRKILRRARSLGGRLREVDDSRVGKTVATAYERGAEIGVSEAIWADAQSEFGRSGATVLVLLADADSIERQGTIRCPAAWVRAMAARNESQPIRLS